MVDSGRSGSDDECAREQRRYASDAEAHKFRGAVAVLMVVAVATLAGATTLAASIGDGTPESIRYDIKWSAMGAALVLVFGLVFSLPWMFESGELAPSRGNWADRLLSTRTYLRFMVACQGVLVMVSLTYLLGALNAILGNPGAP